MLESFTKSDLKCGDIVETRNGNKQVVFGNILKDISRNNEIRVACSSLDNYTDDLVYCYNKNEFDIISVFHADSPYCCGILTQPCIWRRPEEYKLTKQEAEKELSNLLHEKVVIE